MMFWALLKAEWTKTMRMRTTYISFVAVALLALLIQLGFRFRSGRDPLTRSFRAFDLDVSWIINGYTATQVAMVVAFAILIVPMTIMTFARQVSGETLGGTLRMILARPISRFALLNAKFLVCMGYSAALMGFFFAFSFGLGVALFGWTESVSVPNRTALNFGSLSPEFAEMNAEAIRAQGGRTGRGGASWRPPAFDYEDNAAGLLARGAIEERLRTMLISPWECVRRLAIAWGLTTWALITLGSIGFFYSVLNRYSIAAMALTLGTFFLVFVAQLLATQADLIMPLFTSIEPFLFTKAMGYWSHCFATDIDWADIGKNAGLLGAYTAVFYGLAQFLFWRKDVTG